MKNYVHSFWSQAPVERKFPALKGETKADVIIIGGGINGVSTALSFRNAGYDVALIERGAIGAQSSTKNFGTLTTVWNYSSLDEQQSRPLVAYAERKIADLHETLKNMGLGEDFHRQDNWRLIKEASNFDLGQEEYTTALNAGYDCSFVPAEQVKVTTAPTFGAVRIGQWVVDPAKLMHDLRRLADLKGVRIYEGTSVTSVKARKDSVIVCTPGGKAVAEQVVICANGFTNSMGVDSLSHSLPIHIHALATGALPPEIAAQIGTEYGAATDIAPREQGHKVYWQRLLPSGQLLFGGGEFSIPSANDRLDPSMTDRKADALVKELHRRYPFLGAQHVDCFWSGAITGPAGEKPVIASFGPNENVTIVQSCFGHGMGLAPAVGDAVLEHLNPGTATEPGPKLLLSYASPTPSFMRSAEGLVFRLLANSPVRQIANAVLAP